ncbi:unnamed protein product [Adineta ricciae]|uniref:Uncharacterized protein n=1 Tax=Adineta ricciae TaxID=249248 RepID=A0A814TYQ8_ADIRI|nr:unnamed protein product [Adineta ricciae]CAF1166465.1 unnamed protein product [Adineta ricciae]
MLSFRFAHSYATFVDLGLQMKQLSYTKQFSTALSSFNNQYLKRMTSLAINQARRVSIHSSDFQRAELSHQELSSSLLNNQLRIH